MRLWGLVASAAVGCVLTAGPVSAQGRPASTTPAAEAQAASAPSDPLGRETPRGTVLGFLAAARRGDYAVAHQYLDTRLGANAAQRLARQLFVVLDARLPARLMQISDEPEGSRANVLEPDRELVGTIDGRQGTIDIVVERVSRGRGTPVWLFPDSTLDAIPPVFDEIAAAQRETAIPRFLTEPRAGGVRLIDWIVPLLGLPLFFVATAMLNRLLVPVVRPLWRRVGGRDAAALHTVLPVPGRLLLLALAGRWILSWLPLSLIVRQFWSNATGLVTILAIVWLLILLNGEIEQLLRRRLPPASAGAGATLLRVLRRLVDALFAFGGFTTVLWHYGINPAPALAGLGVGGLAVALAAQKTLENVIAGASLIFDQAVRVGDFLRVGAIEGTVDHIGLRSTRIRTLDRSIVRVPNGQIATASLETLSERDKYWFHPEVRLRHDTSPQQLRAVLEEIRRLLSQHPAVDQPSIRVRFVRLGPFSFDVDVFAYLFARDWNHFLEMQEALLFAVTDAVERAGTALALPSQRMYLTGTEQPPTPLASLPAGVG